eukprot:scaffold13308_cov72-Skeletonema_dohrnii-CCMP3373.AAC.2
MWRGHQAVQSSAQRWLLRGRHQASVGNNYHHPFSSARCLGGAASYGATDKLLLQKPSIRSLLPSLVRYGDVRANNLSNPELISSHAFSTRGGKRPRVPLMRDLHSVDEVIVTAYEYLDDMSRRDISAVWARIALLMTKRQPKQRGKSSHNTGKLSFDDMEHILHKIFNDTANGIEDCNMKELAATTLGMAKIVKILRQQGKSRGEDNSRAILRRLLLSKDMKPNRELFKLFANASMDKLDQFDARHLSNLAYAYALIDHVPEFDDGSDLFDHIAMKAVEIKAEFNAQGISNATWAYATVGKPHRKLFEAIGDQVVASKHLNEFKSQNLSNTVWAYATAGVRHPKFVGKAISNTLWAYAKAGFNYPELFEKVANHIVKSDGLDRFIPQHLSNITWAYATAQVSQPKLFQRVAKAAIQRKEEFISQDVANLLWAYATMGITDKQLFLPFVPTAAKLVGTYNNQDIANMAWAYAVADVDDPTLFNAHFINKCVEKKDGFEMEALRQLYQWHLGQTKEKSKSRLPLDLQERCYDIFISEEPTVSKFQDDVVAQLSSIGLEPKEEVLMGSGYRIDAIVEVNEKTIGIEVDGPSHFIGRIIGRSMSPTGSTILKRRQVPSIDGIDLVPVPYLEWNKLGKDRKKKQEYLRKLLGLTTVESCVTACETSSIRCPKFVNSRLGNPMLRYICYESDLFAHVATQELLKMVKEHKRDETPLNPTSSSLSSKPWSWSEPRPSSSPWISVQPSSQPSLAPLDL